MQPASVSKRAGTRASSARQSNESRVNVGAAALVQQLSDISRKMVSGNLDPSQLGPLESRRDALIGELSQNYSVQVVHRSDGTIRVRNKEGHVLLDSAENRDGPALTGAESSQASTTANTTAGPVVASAAYERITSSTGESPVAPVAAAPEALETAVIRETSLDPVSSMSTVQTRIDIVSNLETNLQQSTESLSRAASQTGSLVGLLGI